MGSLTRTVRFAIVTLLAVVLVLPATGHAAETTYTAPYAMGPQDGDASNHFDVDPETGKMTVLRIQAAGISGGLGCGGRGGFSYFSVTHPAAGAQAVTVSFAEAVIDPYTFIHVAVRQGSSFLTSKGLQGLIVHPAHGATSLTVNLDAPATDAIEVWFGIQVTSACPNVDGGTAKFTSVTVTS